jgi:hypothetical protein
VILVAPVALAIALFIFGRFLWRNHKIKKHAKIIKRDGRTFRQQVREETKLQNHTDGD